MRCGPGRNSGAVAAFLGRGREVGWSARRRRNGHDCRKPADLARKAATRGRRTAPSPKPAAGPAHWQRSWGMRRLCYVTLMNELTLRAYKDIPIP